MHPSTQNSAPTLGVDKKCLLGKYSMFYKIVISLNMWFKRCVLCKSIEKEKNWTHEGPSTKEKNDQHMKAHVKKREIAMFLK